MTNQPPPPPGASPAASAEGAAHPHHTLPVGTQIGGLEITGLIGEGGFGVVYLAFDATLQRQVALKEYMPSSLASRSVSGTDVSVKAGRYAETFAAGLRSFVNEARLLAHFDHPALVKVHQFWQANRTAYMVMPYYQGPTLKAHLGALAAQGKTPDEATLRQWLVPLLDALELMHSEQCYHRDVAPDNILLTANGPLLLDFGAARRVISDMTHALTVMLKPGYAPIEQYGDAASMAQGPWTDLYALGSVIYFAITGHSPITSVERVMGDPLPALANVAAGRYSASFLRAIDAALAVRPKDRPQSVAEFRALLQSAEPVARVATFAPLPSSGIAAASPSIASADVRPMPSVAPRPARRGLLVGGLLAGAIAIAFVAAFMARRAHAPGLADTPTSPASPTAVSPAPSPMNAAVSPLPVPTDSPKVEPSPTKAAPVPAAMTASAPAMAAESAAPGASSERAAAPKSPRASRSAAGAASAQTGKPMVKAAAKPVATGRAPDATPRPVPLVVAPAPTPPSVATPSDKPAVAARPVASAPAPTGKPPRCAEILQRGNQQPLGTDDIDFLRKNCR